jgi:hypothetical protein
MGHSRKFVAYQEDLFQYMERMEDSRFSRRVGYYVCKTEGKECDHTRWKVEF